MRDDDTSWHRLSLAEPIPTMNHSLAVSQSHDYLLKLHLWKIVNSYHESIKNGKYFHNKSKHTKAKCIYYGTSKVEVWGLFLKFGVIIVSTCVIAMPCGTLFSDIIIVMNHSSLATPIKVKMITSSDTDDKTMPKWSYFHFNSLRPSDAYMRR